MTIELTINDVPQDLTAGRLSLGPLKIDWRTADSFEFVEHRPHTEANFSVEDDVALSVDGTVRFRGRIKRMDLEGVPGAERIVYHCFGLRELAKDVTVRDPDHGAPRVVFNAPADDEDYDAARADKTVGEIIAWLFDEHADELRAAGVIGAAPATGYVEAELDDLELVPPKVVFASADFEAALVVLMQYQPGHRFLADPETQTYHFRRIAELPAKTLTYNSADRPLSAVLRPSTEGRATAVEISGPMRPVNETAYLSDDGLTPLWDEEYEADWTWAKAFDPANGATYGPVFRRFQIADEAKRRMARELAEPAALGENPPERGPQVYRKTAGDSWARVPVSFDFASGIVLFAQPATVGDEYAEGGAACADDIALVYAWLDEPLSVRVPVEGFEGTAYTQLENPVEAVRRIYDENFTRPEQTTDYEARARELLDACQDIVYAGTVRIGTLDGSLAGLGHRLNFAAQDDDGNPVTTGFESLGAVPLTVTYDFARGQTEIALSSDLAPFVDDGGDGDDARIRELATQARRAAQHRAVQNSALAPMPRAGNDGEIGAAANARGVYSLRRTEDDEDARVAGHVDLEAGGGIEITRQADDGRNGFRFSATRRGEWHWFWRQLTQASAGQSFDMKFGDNYADLRWYPVLAGRLTRIIVYTADQLSAGTATVRPSRKTKGTGAACPEVRTDPDEPAAVLSTSTNVAHSAADPGVEFSDDDVLGLRLITSSDFGIAESYIDVIAGAYFEEE